MIPGLAKEPAEHFFTGFAKWKLVWIPGRNEPLSAKRLDGFAQDVAPHVRFFGNNVSDLGTVGVQVLVNDGTFNDLRHVDLLQCASSGS